jgi:hypothetical protein
MGHKGPFLKLRCIGPKKGSNPDMIQFSSIQILHLHVGMSSVLHVRVHSYIINMSMKQPNSILLAVKVGHWAEAHSQEDKLTLSGQLPIYAFLTSSCSWLGAVLVHLLLQSVCCLLSWFSIPSDTHMCCFFHMYAFKFDTSSLLFLNLRAGCH